MNIDTLKIKNKSELFEYSFDDLCFYSAHKSKFSSGKTPYLLENLSPKFGYGKSYDMEKIKMLRVLFILAISSLVIFFSEYNEKIPLLAPVLLLMAVIPFLSNLNNFTPTSWVRIYDDTGGYETSIPVPRNETTEESEKRKIFLTALSKKIEESYGEE
ncbi:MAG: hypothetical protein ACJA1U_002413 [Bermanella sp.]|jgi:hypothetical protein